MEVSKLNSQSYSPENTITAQSALTLLAEASKYGIVDIEGVLKEIEMKKNKEIIEQHPYAITQGANGRWYTYVADPNAKHGRRQIAKSTKQKVLDAIISDYHQHHNEDDVKEITLEELYKNWMIWRRNTGTAAKTIKENYNDWHRFLESNVIAQKKVAKIDMFDLETFFLAITKNHAITYKCLTNVKSLLNGIFKYGIRLRVINDSPMHTVDFKQFQTRCKPQKPPKGNYTLVERKEILDFLNKKNDIDIYDLAIELCFYLCLRIGELIGIKKCDIKDNRIYISRSIRKEQIMNDDLTFSPVQYSTEERIKGNKTQGFRSIPLTPQAQEIITKTLKLNPDGDFLFMKDGQPIYADSFNEHLKNKVCKPLNIPYRSSHQIRFTITTMLYEAGVPLNQLSTMLGHSETRTTLHYIRQQSVDPKSSTIMINTLDTDLSDSNPANP